MKNIIHLFTVLKSHHPRLFCGAILAGAAACMFFMKLILFTMYWMDPNHRLQPPEPWMTPGYIARSYDLNPQQIAEFLQLGNDREHPITIAQIANQQGRDIETLLSDLHDWLIATQGVAGD